MPIVAWLGCCIRGRKYGLFLQDIYPDGLEALGVIKPGGLVGSMWSSLNRRAFHRSEAICVLGRDMKALLVRRYKIAAEDVTYIPHWSPFEMDRFRRIEDSLLYKQLGLEGKVVIQYSGNMGLWHDIETIVKAAGILSDDSRFVFIFIGGGMRKDAAMRLANNLNLRNTMWLPFFDDPSFLEHSLTCCHVSLISQRAGLTGVAVPCKLYGILAAGRYIIAHAPADSELGICLSEKNCGLLLEPGDVQGLVDALRKLICDLERIEMLGRQAFDVYRAGYTLREGVRRFDAWLSLSGRAE
jgi:glycosyltransferase involved in cell wall biosynthesis